MLSAPAVGRAALSGAGGGAGGTGGSLYSSRSFHGQYLICDPVNPASGSYSIRYDPSLVSYVQNSLTAVPGYNVTGWIARNDGTDTNPDPVLFNVTDYTYSNLPETGYIQVFFQQNGTTYQPQGAPSGYTLVASGGAAGNQTHTLEFSYNAGVADATPVSYTLYGDPGGRFRSDESYSPADSLTDPAGNVTTQIAPYTLSGSLTPEPASAGLLATAAAGLLLRRRRRAAGQ